MNGPPLPRWQWRPVVMVLGSVAAFGLIVNHLGMVVSTVLLIVASSAASHEFRFREALVAGSLLAALAVGVFVIGLKLQLPIWPAILSAARGALQHLGLGLSVATQGINLLYALIGVAAGDADRRAARHRPGRDDRDAAADDLRAAAGLGADHAGRHLLRRAVRRLDDVDPAQHAGRDVVGGDLPRRLPDGAQGPGGRRALDRGAGLVLRRDRRHDLRRDRRDPAVGVRAQVRTGRILLADGARPDRRGRAGARVAC